MLYGLLVSVPIGELLAKNATEAIDPSASLALAETVIAVPCGDEAPLAGAVRLTVGATFDGAVTVIGTAVDVVGAPWLSVATAVSE